MKVKFYSEIAPGKVANVVKRVKSKFNNGLTFHRVFTNFFIQDSYLNDTDSNVSGNVILCKPNENYQYYDCGVLSMAHAGGNTTSSQFFICLKRHDTKHFNRNYSCLGKVIENLNVN